ncbi:MAG: hypothetical protein LDL41_14570 [Coleofasciculus sp. S288]|nr:hypothetical protein [Coleofasciculus sp. S288]
MLKKHHLNRFVNRGKLSTGAVGLALMAMFLPACGDEEPTARLTVREPEPDVQLVEDNVTAEEVAEETAELIGQSVTVRSEVLRLMDPYSFTISSEQFFGGEPILVINASGSPFVVPTGDTEVQVTGEVRRFVFADIEREFGLELGDPNLYIDYESKPVIIAQSSALAPEPEEIVANPTPFYNVDVAVEAGITDILSPTAFTLSENELIEGRELLVINATPGRVLGENQEVVVTGRLRPFIAAEIVRDYDLGWDLALQRELDVRFRNKPVLVAKYVFPSAIQQ